VRDYLPHPFSEADTVMEGNPGSMKVLINSGFNSEGVSQKGFIKNEVYLDEHRFGILNPGFF
jgi:RimJ/RimL family protein N-acetyltransferase